MCWKIKHFFSCLTMAIHFVQFHGMKFLHKSNHREKIICSPMSSLLEGKWICFYHIYCTHNYTNNWANVSFKNICSILFITTNLTNTILEFSIFIRDNFTCWSCCVGFREQHRTAWRCLLKQKHEATPNTMGRHPWSAADCPWMCRCELGGTVNWYLLLLSETNKTLVTFGFSI